jgi:hypothetical protein
MQVLHHHQEKDTGTGVHHCRLYRNQAGERACTCACWADLADPGAALDWAAPLPGEEAGALPLPSV